MRVTDMHTQFKQDIYDGLSSTPKTLFSKYFYDDIGSTYFKKLTQHPDYYLTRTEYSILKAIQNQLPRQIQDTHIDIIEFGVGDGHKTEILLSGFLDAGHTINFYPIDISQKAIDMLKSSIKPHKNLTVKGLVADYMTGLSLLNQQSQNTKLVLFLGSSIGNFNPCDTALFLESIYSRLTVNSYLMIGFDLVKDHRILNQAYNDSASLTKEFNLNLLRRINTELGGHFDLAQFDHYGVFNPELSAMESFIISKVAQSVSVEQLDTTYEFHAYEPIHTEYSFKYTPRKIDTFAQNAGFEVVSHFTDPKDHFIDSLWIKC